MVKNNYESQIELGMLSNGILCVGIAITIVTTLFFGIKLRWFRYRMNMQENPVPLRTHSVTEIRENCSTGQYRQSLQEDVLIQANNELQTPSTSSSSYSVKSKSNRESIFHWPFKNKLSLSKSHSVKENTRPSSIIRSTSTPEESTLEKNERIAQEMAMAEKNERLRRSIYERLHSNNISMLMPDLVQCDESVSPKIMKIQQGLEMSLEEENDEFQMLDEIKEINTIESSLESQMLVEEKKEEVEDDENYKRIEIEEEEEKKEEEEEEIIQAKPSTPPIRRRSRSSSIKINQFVSDSSEFTSIPPVVLPRKKQMLATNTIEPEPETSENLSEEMIIERRRSSVDAVPKSILKTSEATNHSNSTVHFINVPESSSSSEDENDDLESNRHYSVWEQIDMHREQLAQSYQINQNDESPPPLPKTPPPKYEPENKDFSFA